MTFVQDVLNGAIRSSTAVLFAAEGEVVAERSGVINLGTEGCMLVGALTSFAVAANTGSPWLGVAAAAGSGILMGFLHAFFVVTRRTNQLATGLAITFLALGVTAALGSSYVAQSVNPLNPVAIPVLSDIPYVGPVLFKHDVLTYCGLLLGPALWLFLFHTRWGLIIRATGERGDVSFAYGYSPSRVRYLAVMAGGSLAAIGGAQLVLSYTLSWVENVTVGRGFVAVALVIFAAWDPLKTTLGALIYGGALSLQLQLQAHGVNISPFLLNMTPYVLTLAILVVASRGRAQRAPDEIRAVFGTAGA
jgi:simple sugar transport system permease protein